MSARGRRWGGPTNVINPSKRVHHRVLAAYYPVESVLRSVTDVCQSCCTHEDCTNYTLSNAQRMRPKRLGHESLSLIRRCTLICVRRPSHASLLRCQALTRHQPGWMSTQNDLINAVTTVSGRLSHLIFIRVT